MTPQKGSERENSMKKMNKTLALLLALTLLLALSACGQKAQEQAPEVTAAPEPTPETAPVETEAPAEPTPEEKLAAALKMPCPIKKYSGKTLGDLISLDPNSLVWLANKYSRSEEVSAAAKLICESALEASA